MELTPGGYAHFRRIRTVAHDIMLRPLVSRIFRKSPESALHLGWEDYVPLQPGGYRTHPEGSLLPNKAVRGFGRIVMHTATGAWAEGLQIRVLGGLGILQMADRGAALKPGLRERHS